jgi:exonuclease III
MAGLTTYLSILTLNVNRLNSTIKRHCLANWIKMGDLTICCLQETQLIDRNKHWLKVERLEEDLLSQWPPKTDRSSNTYIRKSRLQAYIVQMRYGGTLHTNKRGTTSKVNKNYQPICTQRRCTQFHQTHTKGFKITYRLEHNGSERC